MKNFVDLKIRDAMTKEVISVSPTLSLKALEKKFDKHGFNMFPVIENEVLVGIVSEYDFLKAFITFGTDLRNPKAYKKICKGKTAKDVMSNPISMREWHPLTYALEMIAQSTYKSFPVINDDLKLIGVIARRDLIRELKS